MSLEKEVKALLLRKFFPPEMQDSDATVAQIGDTLGPEKAVGAVLDTMGATNAQLAAYLMFNKTEFLARAIAVAKGAPPPEVPVRQFFLSPPSSEFWE